MLEFTNGASIAKRRTAVSIVFFFLLAGVPLLSAQMGPPPEVKQLVREIIDNELKNGHRDRSRWMYRLQRQAGDSATVKEVKEVIETKDCDIHLLLSSNGKPLSPEESQKENERLMRLVNDSREQQRRKHAQQEDDRKAVEMFKMLPEAFLYQYRSTSGSLIELAFRPNPDFRPASREAQVFHGMEGSMWVDVAKQRLVELDGHLVQDVVFLGGLLGHLEKGGRFRVKRTELGPGEWMITELDLEVKGKALLFKSINLRQKDSMSDFRQIRSDLNAAQAADMLRTAGFAEGTRELADSDSRNSRNKATR